MRKYQVFSIFFVMCMIISIPVKASNQDYTTSVQYIAEEKDRQTLQLEVEGYGSIFDGNQTIKNGIMEYQLKVGEEKQFKILPDEGYDVNHIFYSVMSEKQEVQIVTKDLLDQIVNDTITIQVVEGRIHLKIVFDKKDSSSIIENPSNNQTTSNSLGNISPNTGEASTIALYGMVIIPYFILLYLRKIARKEYLQR